MSSARFLALLRAGMVDPGEPAVRSGGHARLRYWPVRVSTLIFSPVVMNSGTWICAPVSRVAGLVPPVDLAPCRPWSVWLTLHDTAARNSPYSGTASLNGTATFA